MHQAAELSRCDLVSEMVLEFDELQGRMGPYATLSEKILTWQKRFRDSINREEHLIFLMTYLDQY